MLQWEGENDDFHLNAFWINLIDFTDFLNFYGLSQPFYVRFILSGLGADGITIEESFGISLTGNCFLEGWEQLLDWDA